MKSSQTKFMTMQGWRYRAFLLLTTGIVCLATRAEEIPKFTSDGFAIPQFGRSFVFPRDHGSHNDFAIEWWYITGHLTATNEERFGFQATFFRRALVTPGETNRSASTTFGNEQIYLAHMALVNETTGEFRYQERLNRNGWDAEAATNTLAVRNGNWSLRLLPQDSARSSSNQFELPRRNWRGHFLCLHADAG